MDTNQQNIDTYIMWFTHTENMNLFVTFAIFDAELYYKLNNTKQRA